MKKKNFFLVLAVSAMLTATTGFLTSCSIDDNPSEEPPTDPTAIVAKGAEDIVHGAMFRLFHVDSLDHYKMPLAALSQVEITPQQNDYYSAKVVEENGVKYVVPVQKKPQDKPLVAVRMKIVPKGHTELGRNVFFVFYNPAAMPNKARTRGNVDETESKVFSDWIGHSMFYWQGLTASKQVIISYDKLKDFGDTILSRTNPEVNEFHKSYSGCVTTKVSEIYSQHTGSSSKKTRKSMKQTLKDGASVGIKVVQKVTGDDSNKLIEALGKVASLTRTRGFNDARVVTRTKTNDFTESFNQSDTYEYFVNMYRVGKKDVALNMSRFEADENGGTPDIKTLYYMTNPQFIKEVGNLPADFNTATFYDEWGTDIITQGRFGGCHYYVYGRKENAYESSVEEDATQSFRTAYPKSVNAEGGGDWLKIFKAANSDYKSKEKSVMSKKENYKKASGAQECSIIKGGNLAESGDISKWLEGFNNKENWGLVSFRTGSDGIEETNDENNTALPEDGPYTYPIDQYIFNIAVGFYFSLGDDATPLDKAKVDKWVAISDRLAENRCDYIASHFAPVYEKPRLVLADILMKEGTNNHAEGEPEPFIDKDPRDGTKYRIYYPMMANTKYSPREDERGYAIETSSDAYIVGSDSKDHYWYYALAPEDDCTGIVDIVVYWKPLDFYYRRGQHANSGVALALADNYVMVKYYDADAKDADPYKKITAVALGDPNKGKIIPYDKIWASTGGSELKRNFTESELKKWQDWWGDSATVSTHKDNKYWFDGALSSKPNKIKVGYSTKTLPIDRLNEKTVCHPLPWSKK